MQSPGGVRRFYRIVSYNPAVVRDFLSYQGLGKGPPDPKNTALYDGVSVWIRKEPAVYKARSWGKPAFVAELAVPMDRSILMARTTDTRWHYTIWAAPELLLRLVSAVEQV